ncbi:MAG TPA: TlpA disulfide reductase family protein [Nitrospirota bacterium]|nr:TlpA disulfide reductase family protein [Nitrospirota bacterium]
MAGKILAVSAFLVLLFSCTDKVPKSRGTMATDFTLQDLNGGKNVALSDMKGRVVLLEFWATWCPPCRASIPGIERLYEKYKDKGVVVLTVSMDDSGWDAVQSFVKENGIKYTVLKGNDDVAEKYQVRSIPMLVVIDKEGKVVKRYLGFGSDQDVERDIKAIL